MFKKWKKPVNYCIKTSPREAYEQICYYELNVRDYTKFMKKQDADILEDLFAALKSRRLKKLIKEDDRFDTNKYCFKVKLEECSSNSAIAKVKITRRSIVTRIVSCFALSSH